jgi:uncharacterized protein YsxB (DUF464 family)
MIEVKRSGSGLTIRGHAGFAPHGQDIVCSAVSALVQTFCEAVQELTADQINADLSPGSAVIQYGNLSDAAKLLEDSLFVGLNLIADNYPDYIRVL